MYWEYREKKHGSYCIRKKISELTTEQRNALFMKNERFTQKGKDYTSQDYEGCCKPNPASLSIPARDVSSNCVYRQRTFSYLVWENYKVHDVVNYDKEHHFSAGTCE